ncbi:hypothetical protein P8452_47572 [Trifolium repens]|nr:hypothetical protein P8452_47572 [Trifolium repens]
MNAWSMRKNHICWIKVMPIWCTFHKIKVEGNLVYLTYREEKKSKYTKSEGNGYTFKTTMDHFKCMCSRNLKTDMVESNLKREERVIQ